MTIYNLLNIIVCTFTMFYCLIKKVLFFSHNVIAFFFYSWKKESFMTPLVPDSFCFTNYDAKFYLFLESLDCLSNPNMVYTID